MVLWIVIGMEWLRSQSFFDNTGYRWICIECIYIYTVKLGWGFVKPIARETNERFRGLRYSLHAEGGWLCMQHPGPRNRAAILEAFPSSGNIAAPFLGPVFGTIFGTMKEQAGAARRSWRPGFRPFAGASLPSAMQAAMDTHTCSEIAYRITDVECIVRAKTPQLNLTGMVRWPNVYIYCDIPAAHDGTQGLSLQCPATAPT